MRRRDFLKFSAVASLVIPLSSRAWAIRNNEGSGKRVIVIFLRGAADGLSVVVPYSDSLYYEMRPTIALQRPGIPNGVLDLDGQFGLHPSLVGMKPFWDEKSLAFIHASGSPDPTRSHFTAQAYMESGTPGPRSTEDGWLNRSMAYMDGTHAATQAVSWGANQPHILRGRMPVAVMSGGRNPMKSDVQMDMTAQTIFDQLYSGSDALSVAYREGQESQRQLLAALQKDVKEANMDARATGDFVYDARTMARLMRNDRSIQICFAALGGWDTHINQGAHQGQLAKSLKSLSDGLTTLRTDLGSLYADTVVLVISEFGRAVHENGNSGTDHGHGNVMWAMGGPVNGGRVYGLWPGLDEENLYEQRDLAITTDFRAVISTVLTGHLMIAPRDIAKIFPSMPAQSGHVATLIHT